MMDFELKSFNSPPEISLEDQLQFLFLTGKFGMHRDFANGVIIRSCFREDRA